MVSNKQTENVADVLGSKGRLLISVLFCALCTIALISMVALVFPGCGTKNPFRRGPEEVEVPVADTNNPPGDTNTNGNDTANTPDTNGGEDNTQPAGVSYSKEVYPILEDKCSSCHKSGLGGFTIAGDPVGELQGILEQVDLGKPGDSPLLTKGAAEVSHGGGEAFVSGGADYNTVLQWITEGAKDN